MYSAPSSGSLTQTVDRAPTTTTLTSAPNPSTFGQPTTLTATVTVNPPGAGTPTGTVIFQRGAIVLGTAPVDGTGHATLTTSGLQVGSKSLTASYSGDPDFLPSTSAALNQGPRRPAPRARPPSRPAAPDQHRTRRRP